MPDFPAWAVSRVVPGDGPVVVFSAGRAVAWSRVPSLKEVRPGDRSDRVLRLCPEARVRTRDASAEAACWEEVLERLHDVTPFIAPLRPPFAHFRAQDEPALHTLAQDLGIRIGLAPDLGAARLAAVRAAGRHVLRVPRERRQAFLDRFPVDLLAEMGYPQEMAGRLKLFGYPSLGSMRHLARRHLEGQFGEDGASLHVLMHPGPDPPMPVYTHPPRIESAFEPDEPVGPDETAAIVRRLVREGAEALEGRRTQRMVLELRTASEARPRSVGRLLPEPHREVDTLERFALGLLERAAREGDRIDRVSLRFEALRDPSTFQTSLFNARPALLGAVRRVNRRYPEAVRRAVCRPHALFPEDEVLLEPFDTASDPTPGAQPSRAHRNPTAVERTSRRVPALQ